MRSPIAELVVAFSFMCAACSSGSSKKGLSEACTQSTDCASDTCVSLSTTIGGHQPPDQCGAPCGADSVCKGADPRGVCYLAADECALGCAKDSDCPTGASCVGNACLQQ